MQRFLKSIFVTAVFFSMGIVGIVARAAEPGGAAVAMPATAPAAAAVPGLTGPFHWVDSGPLIQAHPDPKRNVVSIKDPSPVFYEGRWHIYATYAKETGKQSGEWGMVYLNFADWKDADKAKPVYLDEYPQFAGYHCARRSSTSSRRSCGTSSISPSNRPTPPRPTSPNQRHGRSRRTSSRARPSRSSRVGSITG